MLKQIMTSVTTRLIINQTNRTDHHYENERINSNNEKGGGSKVLKSMEEEQVSLRKERSADI